MGTLQTMTKLAMSVKASSQEVSSKRNVIIKTSNCGTPSEEEGGAFTNTSIVRDIEHPETNDRITSKKAQKGHEADKKRDEALMAFRREEAQNNREHKIKLAEIYARIMAQPTHHHRFSFSPTQSYRMSGYVNVPRTPLRNQDVCAVTGKTQQDSLHTNMKDIK